jgi:hypothetical protein
LNSTVSDPQDYGFFVPEILSFGAFYCQELSNRKLAQDLTKIKEVQSAMYLTPTGEIRILSEGGQNEMALRYDPQTQIIEYKAIKGRDPLDQIELFRKNKKLTSEFYFSKTLDSPYPNALVRIWEGFNSNSVTKPSVIVNPQLGWVFDNTSLKVLTQIRGFSSSHGSLHKDETKGVLVSTTREFPAIRPQDFRKYFRVEELKP